MEDLHEKYERLLEEERQSTTTMTLANSDKRQEIRTLRTQNTDLLEALKEVRRLASRSPSFLHPTREFAAAVVKVASAAIDRATWEEQRE